MKKKLLMVLSTAIVATGVVVSTSADEAVTTSADAVESGSAINLVVSGTAIECDQAPVIVEGRTLVPVRAIAESVGAEVIWDAENKAVCVENALLDVDLTIGSNEITVANKLAGTTETKEIDVPAQIMNGRTMLPIRAIAENFGLTVDWDQETKTVSITVPGAEVVEETTEAVEETEETTEIAEETEETTEAIEEDTEAVEEAEEATEADEETEETTETVEETEETTEAVEE